jgi:hypothetical protein
MVRLGLQIVQAVEPLRANLDACLIFPSMPAVMKLNKLGTFSMGQLGQSKSIIGDFIKSARKVCSAAMMMDSSSWGVLRHQAAPSSIGRGSSTAAADGTAGSGIGSYRWHGGLHRLGGGCCTMA